MAGTRGEAVVAHARRMRELSEKMADTMSKTSCAVYGITSNDLCSFYKVEGHRKQAQALRDALVEQYTNTLLTKSIEELEEMVLATIQQPPTTAHRFPSVAYTRGLEKKVAEIIKKLLTRRSRNAIIKIQRRK